MHTLTLLTCLLTCLFLYPHYITYTHALMSTTAASDPNHQSSNISLMLSHPHPAHITSPPLISFPPYHIICILSYHLFPSPSSYHPSPHTPHIHCPASAIILPASSYSSHNPTYPAFITHLPTTSVPHHLLPPPPASSFSLYHLTPSCLPHPAYISSFISYLYTSLIYTPLTSPHLHISNSHHLTYLHCSYTPHSHYFTYHTPCLHHHSHTLHSYTPHSTHLLTYIHTCTHPTYIHSTHITPLTCTTHVHPT